MINDLQNTLPVPTFTLPVKIFRGKKSHLNLKQMEIVNLMKLERVPVLAKGSGQSDGY